ncbi:MAG: hypothetical protein J6T43_03550 [Prevotella sp.]|nr:hypothetical protein [Prevotella sp.]
MKRYLTMLIALVAIAMGAKAATDYGFKIGGAAINSDNYESVSQGQAWYYVPAENVLYLTDGTIYGFNNGKVIEINSDKNPSLKICVQGDCTLKGIVNQAINFIGEGHHEIYGSGILRINPDKTGAAGINSEGNTYLTIKDVTIDIRVWSGFAIDSRSGFKEITIDNSEISMQTGDGYAWINQNTTVKLRRCYVEGGKFDYSSRGGIVNDDGTWTHDSTIKRSLWDFNLTVNEPVAGGTVSNSCQFNGTGCEVEEVKWNKLLEGGYFTTENEGSVFQMGSTYEVIIRILANDGERIASREDCVATINGKPAEIYNSSDNYIVLYYTFPQIPDPFYDLWVSDQPVKESNRNALPTTSGTCSYDPVTKTLTLNSAQITNTDYNIEGTVSGFGIYSNIDGLTINVVGNNYINSTHWVGLFSMRNLTITGTGKLFIEANNGGTGLAMGSYGYKLNITGGVKVDAYGGYGVTGGIHTVNVGGEELTESYVTTLSVSSPDAELRAYGTQQCVKDIPFLGEGMEFICENNPNVKLYHKNRSICYYERSRYFPYSNDWIKMTNPNGGISTGLEAIDNGELTIDSSLPLYNLQGQRVSYPVKGQIYIQNGRKVIF